MAIKSMTRWARVAMLGLLGVAAPALAADEWKLELDEEGVQLYTKESPNSKMKTCKVVTTLRGTLSSFVALLNDQGKFTQWMDKVAKVERLQPLEAHESLYYTVIDAPWPAKDQDNVLYTSWSQDHETFEMVQTIMAEPEYLGQAKNKQRQKFFKGEWRLLPVGGGNVRISYTAEIDPGTQRIPNWMSNMFVYEMPVKTIRNMASVPMGDYETATFAYVQEPVDTAIVMTGDE